VTNVVVVLAGVLLVWSVLRIIRRFRRGVVAERGTSIGADLRALGDQPRVRVRAVTTAAPNAVRVILTPELETSSDLDLLVSLREEDFGFELLRQWMRSDTPVAIVQPPGGKLVRLRSVDDLQPLTLRRIDNE
jgi:hypothetical protein